MSLWGYVKKGKQATWTTAFPKQIKTARIKPQTLPKALKPARTSIRKVSKRQAVLNARYSVLAAAYKLAHPTCEICAMLGKTPQPTEHVHHVKGHGKYYLDVSTYKAACFFCHRYVHDNPKWSYDVGLMKLRT